MVALAEAEQTASVIDKHRGTPVQQTAAPLVAHLPARAEARLAQVARAVLPACPVVVAAAVLVADAEDRWKRGNV